MALAERMMTRGVCIGAPTVIGERNGQSVTSGIDKRLASGSKIMLTELGFEGDVQVDQRIKGGKQVHGGELKAVYFYPFDGVRQCRDDLGRGRIPSFGANMTIESGIDESMVCIGDIWRVGDAEVQITLPRRPCANLNLWFGWDVIRWMISSGCCGWYARVVRPGLVPVHGCEMTLVSREDNEPITVAEAFRYKAKRQGDTW